MNAVEGLTVLAHFIYVSNACFFYLFRRIVRCGKSDKIFEMVSLKHTKCML